MAAARPHHLSPSAPSSVAAGRKPRAPSPLPRPVSLCLLASRGPRSLDPGPSPLSPELHSGGAPICLRSRVDVNFGGTVLNLGTACDVYPIKRGRRRALQPVPAAQAPLLPNAAGLRRADQTSSASHTCRAGLSLSAASWALRAHLLFPLRGPVCGPPPPPAWGCPSGFPPGRALLPGLLRFYCSGMLWFCPRPWKAF